MLREPEADLAVWAISTAWCRDASATVCRAAGKSVDRLQAPALRHDTEAEAAAELLANQLPPCLWPIYPFRLNERLTVQQGLFIAPGDVRRSFAENLAALNGRDDESNLRYFEIPRSARAELSRELHEANVTDATLFPGLDGFSRSLWTSARFLDMTNLGPSWTSRGRSLSDGPTQ
jgi:hypothetical protein